MSTVSVFETAEPTRSGPPPAIPSTIPSQAAGSDHLLRLVTTLPTPTTTMVEVTGEVDLLTAPRFAGVLAPAPRSVTRTLVVDLSAVTFISAIGLDALVRANHHTRSAGQKLTLITGTRCVDRVLEITGLQREFACYPVRPTAPAA